MVLNIFDNTTVKGTLSITHMSLHCTYFVSSYTHNHKGSVVLH